MNLLLISILIEFNQYFIIRIINSFNNQFNSDYNNDLICGFITCIIIEFDNEKIIDANKD